MSVMQELEPVVKRHGNIISSDLRSTAKSKGHVRSGRLVRGFTPRVRKDGEDIWGLSFAMKRYGYILQHGVRSQVIEDPWHNRVYQTKGIKPSGFITEVLDKRVDDMADDISKITADYTVRQMRF